MRRRDFVRATGSGVAVAALAESIVSAQTAATPAPARNRPYPPARMKAGTQHGDSDAILRVMAGFGITNICSRLPSAKMDDAWSVDGLSRLRERVESFGISLDMVPLPLSSNEISRSENPAILLAREPDRERQLDDLCGMIRNVARAGIPSVKYNLTLLGVPRTAPTRGRGGARYSTFVYEGAAQEPPLTIAGAVDPDTYWERITYFLERVVPVAEEFKVRLSIPGVSRAQALSVALEWNAELVEPLSATASDSLTGMGGLAFTAAPRTLDAALMGVRGSGTPSSEMNRGGDRKCPPDPVHVARPVGVISVATEGRALGAAVLWMATASRLSR